MKGPKLVLWTVLSMLAGIGLDYLYVCVKSLG